MMVFAVEPAVVGASAMTQAGLAARLGAGVAAAAPTLSAVVPVGEDADSAACAAVVDGGARVFSDAQSMAGATMAVASEAMRAVALSR
ncbi:PE domain-containing protein [Mycobacterium ostraviense]|nr:PE domain-containing protein [Mycobacterium ostraviense]UGT90459.1 PE domain-containing protein [Mycobacterium ostraviense]